MENQGKSKYEKGRKDKTKIKEVEEKWKSVEMGRWPKEKYLLDKGDGLATAAGARGNDEVTSHISTYIQIPEGSSVRLTVAFRRS